MCVCAGCAPAELSDMEEPTDGWTYPQYAKGFRWMEMSGDSVRMQVIDLTAPEANTVLTTLEFPRSGYERIATLSTTHLNLLQTSGDLSPVVAAAFLSYVSDTLILKEVEQWGIRSLGRDDPDPEVLLDAEAQLFMVYPFGDANYDAITQAGMDVLPISEYLETHPLGRAEWMVLTGMLAGRGELAQRNFLKMAERYEALSGTFRDLQEVDRPVLFSGSQDGGAWFAPGGDSFISIFARDAGGRYLFEDRHQTGNISLDIEVFLQVVAHADVWGLVTYSDVPVTLPMLLQEESLLKDMPFIEKGGVIVCNTAEADYFGRAIVEPETLLADLIAHFHPGTSPEHTFTYFKPVSHE